MSSEQKAPRTTKGGSGMMPPAPDTGHRTTPGVNAKRPVTGPASPRDSAGKRGPSGSDRETTMKSNVVEPISHRSTPVSSGKP